MLSKFPLGRLLTTPGAREAAEAAGDDLMILIGRHGRGDWGVIDETDKQVNERSISNGSRLFSAYLLKDGTKVWIITEADRAATMVLLPNEY